MAESHTPFTRRGFELLGLNSESNYLDIGCGNGYTVRWAAEACPQGRAVGLDVSTQMISRARALSEELENASFIQSAFPTPELISGSFDAILSMEVFYYLPDLAAGLSDVTRILQPGGRFACLVDFYAENEASHSWPQDLGVHMTLLDAGGWKKAIQDAGMTVTEQRQIRLDPAEASEPWKAEVGSLLTLGVKRD